MAPQTPPPLTLPLDAGAASLARVGGKGAALAKLAAAGLPIPPGFHLATAAYRHFVAHNGLQAPILAAATAASAADPVSQVRAAATIQALFAGGAMPEPVAAALRTAYTGLGQPEPPVAVRSSATAEDLPELSFAGQQETLLNVRGAEALLRAVQRCWASLWTARAIGYRERMGIDQGDVVLGVLVQVLIPAEVSGVLFTANPTTGDRAELVVNAAWGLGEAVVSGQVTPDTYLLDRTSLARKQSTIGRKAVMVVATGDQGTAVQEVPAARRRQPALSDRLLRELGSLALRVEQQLGGRPQDLEWAVADGRCWILQARPITNLPPPPMEVRWEPPSPGSSWIRRQVVEHMPEPLSPLFDELYLRDGLERSVEQVQPALGLTGAVNRLVDRPIFATVNGFAYQRASLKLGWTTVPVLAKALAVGLPTLFRRAIPYWRDDALPFYLAAIERWRRLDLAAATDRDLLQGLRELARADARYWYGAALAIGVAKVSESLLGSFLEAAVPGRGLTSGHYLRGFTSRSQQAEAELEALAERIRASDRLRDLAAATPSERLLDALAGEPDGRALLTDLHGYLERYGHQIYSLDFAVPTQIDDPRPVLLSLQALARGPSGQLPTRQGQQARERDRQTLETARSLDRLRRRLFLALLRWAQSYAPYREEALFWVGAGWPALRRLTLELGRRLATAGSLDQPDDVFYLESAELAAASTARAAGQRRPDLAALAGQRRALREARKRLHPPAAVPTGYRFRIGPFDLSGREAQRRNRADSSTLVGFAVSPGRVTAPATVLLSPADFGQMEPGTILVCPTTTPAWTPLFAQARGLVTDIGGVLAHGSIVAREYGIPAVMGTGDATRRIRSGQSLTVDGDAGTVSITPLGADNGPVNSA